MRERELCVCVPAWDARAETASGEREGSRVDEETILAHVLLLARCTVVVVCILLLICTLWREWFGCGLVLKTF